MWHTAKLWVGRWSDVVKEEKKKEGINEWMKECERMGTDKRK